MVFFKHQAIPKHVQIRTLQNTASRQLSGMETEDTDTFGPNLLGLAKLLTPAPARAAACSAFHAAKGSLQKLLHKNTETEAKQKGFREVFLLVQPKRHEAMPIQVTALV